MKKAVMIALLAAMLLAASCTGLAQTAENITEKCEITAPRSKTTKVHDGLYTSYWTGIEQVNPYLEIRTPDDAPAHYLYICFGLMPDAWAIEEESGGEWKTLIEGTYEFDHVCLELGGKTHFRLIDTTGKKTKFKINDVFVFGEGELPDWVQRWEPTPEKANLLVLSAHPDDELIFMGGTIPTYAAERGMNVVVAYMTYSNTTRKSELLNGLWHMGVRQYPVIGTFRDTYFKTAKEAYRSWNKDKAYSFVTEVIRKYRPEVIVTHDVNGEYGHGAHKACAEMALEIVPKAGDPAYDEESAALYGTWTPKKLYLHLYAENKLTMDWRKPLESFGGKTGLELAQEAYGFHVTQHTTKFTVTDEGGTSCAEFGLAFTTVGQDVEKDDFFENVPGLSEAATPESKPAADVQWPIEKPELDSYGYPVEGEHVLSDEEGGVWFYASPTLVVRVDRVADTENVITQYEAQIYCDTEKERVGAVLYNEEKPQKEHVQAAKIAREKQVVFGLNTDYYTYRLGRKTITGMVIRGGKVFFDRVPNANRSLFPNLDTLAMYEDGSWKVFLSDELTAEQYLADGAVDVFSFGPYLIRDGEINGFIDEMKSGKTAQPRCAIGMVEPGHYYALLVEGRSRRYSVGCSIAYLAEEMKEKGCVQALNLDGGQTAVFTFMGDQISRIAKYSGGKTYARKTTEIIGVGRSDLIDPTQKPYYPKFP